jgi:hypothetical protein
MPPYLAVRHLRDDLYVKVAISVNIVLDSPMMRADVFGPILPYRRSPRSSRSIDVF